MSKRAESIMVNVQGGGRMACVIVKHPNTGIAFAPRFELEAPDGFRFCNDTVHSYPCGDMLDVEERATFEMLEPCPADCDCRESGSL